LLTLLVVHVTAVLLSAVWFLTALVLRVVVQVRCTADHGVRLPAATHRSAEWWVGVALVPATVAIVAGPGLVVAGAIDPVTDAPAVTWTGLVATVVGIVATFVAQLQMGASWRIGVDPSERTALVTTGAFGLVRNPIFTTMVVTAVGLTAMAPTPLGVLGSALLVAAIEAQVRLVEEPYLSQTHGAAYRAYARAAGRFVPFVGRVD
jgi:protein-S-isoprenylcysteine O-methyltransferase Ste14